jgi:O-acetyl-ADP-ribose deacetylase (regulator of RNase III)
MTVRHAVLELVEGDITHEKVDAIVNAANSELIGGAGVDGAIRDAGGPVILAECREIHRRDGSLPIGEAVITTAGNLPARHVIHTVGPIYGFTRDDAGLLASCHRKSLELAVTHDLRTIAFPAISTGVYGYPMEKAAPVALGAVRDFLLTAPPIDLVRFVLFGKLAYRLYVQAMRELEAD